MIKTRVSKFENDHRSRLRLELRPPLVNFNEIFRKRGYDFLVNENLCIYSPVRTFIFCICNSRLIPWNIGECSWSKIWKFVQLDNGRLQICTGYSLWDRREFVLLLVYAIICSAIVHILTWIYADCSTYELTEQFMQICVKRWTIRQTISRHVLFCEITRRSHLD